MPTSPSITRYRIALVIFSIAMGLVGFWPQMDLSKIGLSNDRLPFGVDKWIHVISFAGLLVLLLGSDFTPLRGWRKLAAHVIPLVGWAFAAEWMQSLTGSRGTFDLDDIAASCIGVGIGAVLWLFIRWLSAPATSHFGHARVMTGMTLLSRITGLLRDIVLPIILGFGWINDAFVVAFMIPNLFRKLFGEGALAGSFIPHYAKLEKSNPQLGDTFAQTITGALWRILAAVALLIALGSIAFWQWGGLTERGQLIAGLTALSVWYMPMVCVAAILGAMLQVHGRFGVPGASPIILNLVLIAAALLGYFTIGRSHPTMLATFIIGGMLVGGFIQVLWHLYALRTTGRRSLPASSPRAILREHPDVRTPARAMLAQWFPTVMGLSVLQVNILVDTTIATFLSAAPGQTFHLFGHAIAYPMRIGAVAVLATSQRLYQFPLGVFAIPVAMAFFPALSRTADDRASFSELVRQGLRLTIFIGLPAAVGLILIRDPLCKTMFAKAGNIAANDYQRVAWVLLGYAPAVWAYSANHILVRTFYAHHNPKTPMRVSIAMVALNIVLNLTLVWLPAPANPVGDRLGPAGLAWSTAICAFVQFLILLRLSRRYVDRPIDRTVIGSWLRCIFITAVMAVPVWLVIHQFDVAAFTRSQALGLLLGATALGGIVFLAAAAVLKMPELHWAISRKK